MGHGGGPRTSLSLSLPNLVTQEDRTGSNPGVNTYGYDTFGEPDAGLSAGDTQGTNPINPYLYSAV